MDAINNFLSVVNGVIWHNYVLYAMLGVGVLFTLWSGFCQYRALTHGIAVTRGKYDKPDAEHGVQNVVVPNPFDMITRGVGAEYLRFRWFLFSTPTAVPRVDALDQGYDY